MLMLYVYFILLSLDPLRPTAQGILVLPMSLSRPENSRRDMKEKK
jgi:hypothetical protein